jgi:hypothetical protein
MAPDKLTRLLCCIMTPLGLPGRERGGGIKGQEARVVW